ALPDRPLLEMLAWGVLNKAESSNQLTIRLNSLLAAAFTKDVKAVPILMEQLKSPNAMLRCIAIKLAASYADACLKNQIAHLVKEEKVWYVRLDAIQAAGHLRILELKPYLKEVIANPKTLIEEKASAIIALVSMYDQIDEEEVNRLIRSDRAGLRQLACEAVCHLNAHEHLDLILPLLKDPSSDVRLSALNTLALMKEKRLDHVLSCLDDPSPSVAITAAFCALLMGSDEGERRLQAWLDHKNIEYVRLASAALAASGRYGKALSLKNIKTLQDPYALANLALGLIGQRENVEFSCQILYQIFCSEKQTLWMWDNSYNPLFRSLAPSDLSQVDHVPHYPLVVNQMTRLEILSLLSILRFSGAQEAVRDFLQRQAWGVMESAAFTLLQEGDEEDLTVVRDLLSDPDEKMRVQAALILGMAGGDPEAVKVLQQAYPHMDRQVKIHILEALAHIGDPQSIPFFLEIFKEPFQVMRVIAASALIQCLYH
ncbi:MAG: HEAT repeat domain-containing protein, partial [Chlamydiales bacterium]|nr:HEAT repeat domain-containing protein [Chlamydiales bacterium]